MFYNETVQDTRQLFFKSWEKYSLKTPLTPLEAQLVDVIKIHPEYHNILKAQNVSATFFAEQGQSNPFLHMGLHLSIRDQIATDRPKGIALVYSRLLKKHSDVHVVEHLMMEPLAECLWNAQRNQAAPDEITYLRACRSLA